MKFFLFLVPFLVLVAIASLLPLLKVSVEPLAPDILLAYESVGGPSHINNRLTIDRTGNIYHQGYYEGVLPNDTLQDLILFLDGNTYSSMVESLYDRYKKEKQPVSDLEVRTSLRLNTVSGTIQVAPDKFLNNILRPYIQ